MQDVTEIVALTSECGRAFLVSDGEPAAVAGEVTERMH